MLRPPPTQGIVQDIESRHDRVLQELERLEALIASAIADATGRGRTTEDGEAAEASPEVPSPSADVAATAPAPEAPVRNRRRNPEPANERSPSEAPSNGASPGEERPGMDVDASAPVAASEDAMVEAIALGVQAAADQVGSAGSAKKPRSPSCRGRRKAA